MNRFQRWLYNLWYKHTPWYTAYTFQQYQRASQMLQASLTQQILKIEKERLKAQEDLEKAKKDLETAKVVILKEMDSYKSRLSADVSKRFYEDANFRREVQFIIDEMPQYSRTVAFLCTNVDFRLGSGNISFGDRTNKSFAQVKSIGVKIDIGIREEVKIEHILQQLMRAIEQGIAEAYAKQSLIK